MSKTEAKKKTITVSLISISSTLNYTCSYFDPDQGELVSILTTGDLVMGQLKPGEKALTINFSSKEPRITLEYDPEAKDNVSKRMRNQEAFWRRCPLVKLANGVNKNMAQGLLLLVDLNEVVDRKSDVIYKQHRVASRVLEASPEERRKIAIFYGSINVHKMTDKDVLVELIDYNTGRLMNPNMFIGFGDRRTTMMEHYLERFGEDDIGVKVAVNTRKAIEYGLIEIRNDSGARGHETFLINNLPVGQTEEQVVAYLVGNQEFYEAYILSRINEHEAQLSIKAGTPYAGKKSGESKVDEKEEKYRSLAKMLKIPAWNNKNLSKLIPEVETAIMDLPEEDMTLELKKYRDELAAARAKALAEQAQG